MYGGVRRSGATFVTGRRQLYSINASGSVPLARWLRRSVINKLRRASKARFRSNAAVHPVDPMSSRQADIAKLEIAPPLAIEGQVGII